MDVMKLANSLPMWIACGIPVVFVMVQALLFAREAYRSGEKVGLTKTQMNKAIKKQCGDFDRAIDCCTERYVITFGDSWRTSWLDATFYDWFCYV